MAINPQNKKDAEEIRELVQDTLISISKAMSEAIRVSVEEAVDVVDAKIKDTLGKDLTRSMTSLAKASKDSANNLYRIREGLLSSRDISKQLTAIDEKRLTLAREVLLAKRNGVPVDQEQLTAINKVLKEEKKLLLGEQQKVKDIEKQIGLTGKLISSMSKIPGLGQFVDAKEIETEMRKVAARGGNTFQTMGVAASMVGKQLRQGLADPLFIVGKILDGFFEVNKAAVEYTRLTGQNATVTAGLNDRLATSAQVLELTADLTKQTGLASGAIFSPDDLGRLAEAKNLLGLSSEQAGNLGLRSKVVGKSIDDYQEGIVKSTNSFNKLNNTAVSHGLVMQDVLSVSDDIALSMGNSDKAISKAAASARSLGLSLEKVDQIAGSIINFEDSIGNELEAQLLTGKNINLAKAREFALSNDLAGLSEELKKNGASAAEFAKMGRIEQESLAKALGMSRSELAKMIMLDETAKNLTDKERAAAMGVKEEQMKQMDIQAKMEQSLAKLAQAFAPILDAMVPIVDLIVSVVGPVAKMVASLSGGIAPFIKYLGIGYGILKGTQLTLQSMLAISTILSALKKGDIAAETSILGTLGLQNAARAFSLTQKMTGNTLTAIAAALNQTILGSILAQGIGLVRNIGHLGKQLAMSLANAAAALTTNAAITFGVGVAIAVGAALAGIAAIKAMTADDMVSSPSGYGKRTLMGPEGAIALNDKDTIIAGTNLFPDSGQGNTQTITPSLSIEPLVQELRGLRTEMLSLIQVVKEGGDVYMDSNKIGKAMVLGTYKSS